VQVLAQAVTHVTQVHLLSLMCSVFVRFSQRLTRLRCNAAQEAVSLGER
jgi:hypothetical protein